MRVLIVSDHFPISPRTKNLRNSLLSMGHHVEIVAWNRNGKKNTESYIRTIDHNISYGNKFKKLLYLPFFISALKNEINDFCPDVIQAIDFEMLIANQMIRVVHNKKYHLIYEVFDIKFFSNKILNYIREKLEFLVIKKVNYFIFASPFFNIYYQLPETLYINLENKIDSTLFSDTYSHYKIFNSKKTIGFVGTVRYADMIKKLIIANHNSINYEIHIYGDGPDLHHLKEFTSLHDYKNVKFFGRYETKQLKEIYSLIDYVWACYPSDDENVRYAVSNKFYESQYFGKPILVSKFTFLGEKVEKNNLGLALNTTSVNKLKSDLLMLSNYNKFKKPINIYKYTWASQENDIKLFYSLIEEKLNEIN